METIKLNELNDLLKSPMHVESINKNHVIVHHTCGRMLFSYGKLVAAISGNKLFLTEYHDYSTTTNKYVKLFTNLSKKERLEALANNTATFINLEYLQQ